MKEKEEKITIIASHVQYDSACSVPQSEQFAKKKSKKKLSQKHSKEITIRTLPKKLK